jgi:hypothetical protein
MAGTYSRKLLIAAAAVALCACGGGGGGGASIASTPTPPPTPPPPPPPPAAEVRIFATPTVGEYATVGVSTQDSLVTATGRITTVSTAQADQPQIRYTASGHYEVKLPGADWDRLTFYKGASGFGPDYNYFQPAGVGQNYGFVVISVARNQGYLYSEMASWGNLNLSAEGGFGYFAFGTPTPAGAVPTTGSASFTGRAIGSSDVMDADHLYGGYTPRGVDGTVDLNFNFGSGALTGVLDLYLNDGMNPISLGQYNFTQTVFSPGSTTYSGRFDTSLSGINFFNGRFTGPSANETIAAWAVPFRINPGGTTHQAIGAWIARQ